MSTALIVILILMFISGVSALCYFVFSKDAMITIGEPGRGQSYYVANPTLIERSVRTKTGKSYSVRLKQGSGGKSYHDFDYLDELGNLLYDIYLMQSLFDFIENEDYEEGYFELAEESDQEYVAEEQIAPEYIVEEHTAPEYIVEEEPAQEYIVEEEIAPEEEGKCYTPTYSYSHDSSDDGGGDDGSDDD